jgi:hypothetical protein
LEPGCRDEISHLRYIDWHDKFNHEKPYVSYNDGQGKAPSTNFTYENEKKEIIRDIRGSNTIFNLDDHGFAARKHRLSNSSFDKQSVEEKYLPSVKQLLSEESGPQATCFIFDWRVRIFADGNTNIAKYCSFGRATSENRYIISLRRMKLEMTPNSTLQ